MKTSTSLLALASSISVLGLAVAACDAEADTSTTGGLGDLGDGGSGTAGAPPSVGGAAGAAGGSAVAGASSGGAGPDNRRQDGVLVINGDYTSTSLSAVDASGEVLSKVIVSSASTDPGLTAAISGDVLLGAADVPGTEAVLIDRSSAVLTFVNLESGDVRAQLNVGTGFASNPQDYLKVGAEKAYVARFGSNGNAGTEPNDAGDDVLIIDPTVPEITGRIDLTPAMEGEPDGFKPSAYQMALAGGQAHLVLAALKPDFSDLVASRVVTLSASTDAIASTLVLDGIRNCQTLAASPAGDKLALACTGQYGQDPVDGWPDAGVVVLEVGTTLTVEKTFGADAFKSCDGDTCYAAQPNHVDWVDGDTLLVTTAGTFPEDGQPIGYGSAAFTIDLQGQTEGTRVYEAGAFDLGWPRCLAEGCFVPDAAMGQGLQLFPLEGESLGTPTTITVDDQIGLPPRRLQRF